MDKPTQEQIKEFWEWCGFRWDGRRDAYCFIAPDGQPFSMSTLRDFESLEILGILFKYAVPKVEFVTLHWDKDFGRYVGEVTQDGEDYGHQHNDPALALFWALNKVRESEK